MAVLAEVRCRCGYGRDHAMVELVPRYRPLGWLLLVMGATPRPYEVQWRCTVCKSSLGVTREAEILRKA